MRNADKRDRRRERAVASLGEHYSQPDSEPFAVSFVNCVRNTVPAAVADLRVSRFQPRSDGVGWFDADAGEFTHGIPKSSQQTEAVNPEKPIAKAASYSECLDLMHRLMAYRHQPIHSDRKSV